MYVSNENANRQKTVKKMKMLTLFNSLEEHDKDIVITMTESLVERNKGKSTTDMTATPVVAERHLIMCGH